MKSSTFFCVSNLRMSHPWFQKSLRFFWQILLPNCSIIRVTVSLWKMLEHQQIVVFEEKCRRFRLLVNVQRLTERASNNWLKRCQKKRKDHVRVTLSLRNLKGLTEALIIGQFRPKIYHKKHYLMECKFLLDFFQKNWFCVNSRPAKILWIH